MNNLSNNKILPTLSIMVVTFNNVNSLPECLQAISEQTYPKELIEYINVDGGSNDGTKDLMKKYNFNIINSPIANAEAQRSIALQNAKNEILVVIDADNYLPHENWLIQMVKPFQEDNEIVYSQTQRFTYRKKDSLFNRYCALFGINDPVVYYIGRPDRQDWFRKKWKLGKPINEKENYYTATFNEDNLPTVGCNGVLVKRKVLLNHSENDMENYLHMDVYVDLVRKNFNKFAIVKNDVIHATAYTLKNLVKKRTNFLTYYFGQKVNRRYIIYDPKKLKDNLKMLKFIVYTTTIIKPLFDSFRGYLKIPDKAWFIHPIACWAFLYAYGAAFAKNKLFHKYEK